VFSPDGRTLAYVARRGDDFFAVINGVEGTPCELIQVGGIRFSADSKHFAYVARRSGKDHLVLDGAEGPPFDFISEFSNVFEAAGRKSSYIGRRGKQSVLMVDGAEAMTAEYIGEGYPRPEPPHTAYVVKRGDGWQAIIDGKPGSWYDSIGNNIHFSGRHWMYRARLDGRDFLVVDGQQRDCAGVVVENSYVFTPDARFAYFAIRNRGRVFVIEAHDHRSER